MTPGERPPRRAGLADDRFPAVEVPGRALASVGLAFAAQRALTAAVILVQAL